MLQTFITQSCLKLCSSRQMQGVVGAALNRQHELRVQCAASALRSSAEVASSVLSTSPESWIARVGRANSSTRQQITTFQHSWEGGTSSFKASTTKPIRGSRIQASGPFHPPSQERQTAPCEMHETSGSRRRGRNCSSKNASINNEDSAWKMRQ